MPGDPLLRLRAKLTISSTGRAFRDKNNPMAGMQNGAWKAAAHTLRSVMENALEYARENVAEGHGPGPHPHIWPHKDTGNLGRSLGIKYDYSGGSRLTGVLYCDAEYGVYLEVGWHTRAGNFFRYPWLKPAYKKAGLGFAKVASTNWKRDVFKSDTGEVTMDSGMVDAYGAQVLELLKPVDGWKQPLRSDLSPEAREVLIQGEIEPDDRGQPDHNRTKRNRDAVKQIRDILESTRDTVKGKSHDGRYRHDARSDNKKVSDKQADKSVARQRGRKPSVAKPRSVDSIIKSYEEKQQEIANLKTKRPLRRKKNP